MTAIRTQALSNQQIAAYHENGYLVIRNVLSSRLLINRSPPRACSLQRLLGESDEICRAVQTWQREDIIRGKGKALHQSKQQFD